MSHVPRNGQVMLCNILFYIVKMIEIISDDFMHCRELQARIFEGNFFGGQAFVVGAKDVMKADPPARHVNEAAIIGR